MGTHVDTSQLREFAKRLEKAAGGDKIRAVEEQCCQELANRVIRSAVKNTPVITGHLKGNYRQSAIYPTGNGYTITVYNPVKYAPYVEYGHRTRGGGWREGKFMLTKATEAVDKKAVAICQKRVNEALREVLNG